MPRTSDVCLCRDARMPLHVVTTRSPRMHSREKTAGGQTVRSRSALAVSSALWTVLVQGRTELRGELLPT